MNKLILAAALLAFAAPVFAEEAAAPLTDDNTLPTIETTLTDEVSGTEAHEHDTGDMFDETAPTADEHPVSE